MVKLTLIGLYNYDQTLFSRLSLPAPLITATAVNAILLEKGEFGSLYTDPDFLKYAIGAWSDANQMAFEHLAKVLAASYDPISNYDRTETETTDTTGSSSETGQKNESGTETETTTDQQSGTNSEEGKLSAYNSSQYQPSDSTTGSFSSSDSATKSGSSGRNENSSSSLSEQKGSRRTLHAFGNIGTTTNAQMMLAEKEVVEGVNPYMIIANMFADAFCIKIY